MFAYKTTDKSITVSGRDQVELTARVSEVGILLQFVGMEVLLTPNDWSLVRSKLEELSAFDHGPRLTPEPLTLESGDLKFIVSYTNWGEPWASGADISLRNSEDRDFRATVCLENRYLDEVLDEMPKVLEEPELWAVEDCEREMPGIYLRYSIEPDELRPEDRSTALALLNL